MASVPPLLRRSDLARAFNNDPLLIAAFEQQQETVAATAEASGASVAATAAIQDATVLTLSPNDSFTNERIFTPFEGLSAEDDGTLFKVRVDQTVARVTGGFSANFITTGVTNLVLPTAGTLATISGTETLVGKTLNAPKLTGLGNYADDSAAAAGGVPVGGVYRDGSVVMVRVS